MNIAILGYDIEGKAAKNYFDTHGHQTTVFQDFTAEQLNNFNLDSYDLVLRSPSVPLKTPIISPKSLPLSTSPGAANVLNAPILTSFLPLTSPPKN